MFVGEVIAIIGILAFTKRIADTPPEEGVTLDVVGTVLSASGLGLIVYGLLRSGTWGFISPKPGAPEWLGLSPAFWLMLGGGVVLWAFFGWEQRMISQGREPLVDPALLEVVHLPRRPAGVLLPVPPAARSVLPDVVVPDGRARPDGHRHGRSADADVDHAPPRCGRHPQAPAERVAAPCARVGFLSLAVGLVMLVALLDVGTGAEIVTWPLMLAGFGAGALASQLGAVTVGAVPDERSGEVGGLQNTATNLGSSIATALAGAVLISALTASILSGLENNTDVPASVIESAPVQLAAGVPFMSDADLEAALEEANVPAGHGRRDHGREHGGSRSAPCRCRSDCWPCSPWSPSS